MRPKDHGGPIGFADRLAWDNWPEQDPRQVCLLLANAFLEDLRRAYRCGRGRWRPRLGSRWHGRRMAYPVLLLDDAAASDGGYRLLALVNEVRDETGLFDPLLVISSGHRPPPASGPDDWRNDRPDNAYRAWYNQLEDDSRRLRPRAWYLRISAPATVPHVTHFHTTFGAIKIDRAPRRSAAKYQLACHRHRSRARRGRP
jgi:hypothetical protein